MFAVISRRKICERVKYPMFLTRYLVRSIGRTNEHSLAVIVVGYSARGTNDLC
jgi:hypothetical protein